jgi:hypothetical protein
MVLFRGGNGLYPVRFKAFPEITPLLTFITEMPVRGVPVIWLSVMSMF